MSFLGGIVGGITTALTTVGGIVSGVAKGVGSVVDASGVAALLTVVSNLTTSITGVVGGVTDALGGIIDPIKKVVESVNTLSTDIESKIIGPLVRPIVDTISRVESLTKTIDRLVDQGISGIIEIPKALAASLSGIEAQWSRASEAIAAANRIIVTDELVPGIQHAVAPGLDVIGAHLGSVVNGLGLNVDNTSRVALTASFLEDFNVKFLSEMQKRLDNPQDLTDKIMVAAIGVFRTILALGVQLSTQVEDATDDARAANPRKKLDSSSALDLWRRGIISSDDLAKELAFAGYNESRQKALREGLNYLPSPAEVIDWAHRGLITVAERNAVLAKHGYNDAEIEATVASSAAPIPEDVLLTWLGKEIISRETYDKRMAGKGYKPEDVARIIQDALLDPQVNTTINWHWNVDAARQGWFTNTYASLPPQDVIDAARRARISPDETTRRWQSQFQAMPVSTAIELFFRGELPRKDVETVVAQNGYPRDMTGYLITAASPLIPTRSVPTLVAKGEITVADGMSRLERLGYSVEDASVLLAGAKESIAKAANSAPNEGTKITAAQARNAYKDGAIDQPTLISILQVIGYGEGDIAFFVALDDYDLAATARKAEIDTIKAEVSLGLMTVDEAKTAFADIGLSDPEILRLEVTLKQTKRAAAKIPDLGLLKQLAKASLIDQAGFLSGVQALGYADPWDTAIVNLQYKGGGVDVQPA